MSTLNSELQPTAQWQKLVKEAEAHNHVQLDEELESYLVFLLMRYTEKPDIAARVMALEYLRGMQAGGKNRQAQLRDVGDQCLLYCGLFPRRAEGRRVKISYYVDLGRSAYHSVADVSHNALAAMFSHLSEKFVVLMDTLQSMRIIHGDLSNGLDLISSFELATESGSGRARRMFETDPSAMPILILNNQKLIN